MKTAIVIISIVQFLLSCYILGVAVFHIAKLTKRIKEIEDKLNKSHE